MASPIFMTAVERWREVRSTYLDLIENQYLAAEAHTRGHMLNKRGRRAGIDPRSLFSGPSARAYLYASDELVEWWRMHPRVTFSQFESVAAATPSPAMCGNCGGVL